MRMKISDIKISEAFAETIPKKRKMEECRRNWDKFHVQDRYIVVTNNGRLIDGYIMYLVLKENGIEEATVRISNTRQNRWHRRDITKWNIPRYRNEETTYIYGIHQNGNCNKEYVWRVPKAWKWFSENVKAGDIILCRTRVGIAPVIITRIEVLDRCPVDMTVKRVACAQIKRNGHIL